MTSAPEFLIEAPASADFARLSGDFNPLHVDALAARRLQFGGTVCHGVHLVLQCIEHLAQGGTLAGQGVATISAVFHQPVRTGVPVQLAVVGMADSASGPRCKVSGLVDGRVQFTVQLQLMPANAEAHMLAVAQAEPEPAADALVPAFPADAAAQAALAGQVPLRANAGLLAALFPALAAWPDGPALAAELMASTRIVGMRCPGLHSIYSEFKLHRRHTPQAQTQTQTQMQSAMTYEVSRADPRFQKVRVALQGALMEGMLEAFFRAPPVAQRSLAEVGALTAAGCLAGKKVLVVGGSRGLGELAAKMLLAGGAEVTLSYARGRSDAESIVAEALAAGAQAKALCLDTSQALPAETTATLAAEGYTHVCYFATPSIAKSPPGTWNAALYDSYTRIYVAGFAAVVRAAAQAAGGAAPLQALYPSTVFLDQAEKGFAEYCCAKAAGETLCDHLTLEGRVQVQRPRLPRMKTDQNSSFLGPEADDPWPVLAATLAQFCGYRTAA